MKVILAASLLVIAVPATTVARTVVDDRQRRAEEHRHTVQVARVKRETEAREAVLKEHRRLSAWTRDWEQKDAARRHRYVQEPLGTETWDQREARLKDDFAQGREMDDNTRYWREEELKMDAGFRYREYGARSQDPLLPPAATLPRDDQFLGGTVTTHPARCSLCNAVLTPQETKDGHCGEWATCIRRQVERLTLRVSELESAQLAAAKQRDDDHDRDLERRMGDDW